MLCSLGGLALAENRLGVALSCMEPAMRLFGEEADTHGKALAARGLAYIARVQGRHADALSYCRLALAALQTVHDAAAEAHVLSNLAQIYLDRQERGEAKDVLLRAEGICRPLGTSRVSAQVQHRLGDLYLRNGELPAAQRTFESVLQTVQQRNDLTGQAYARYGLGLVCARRRRFDEAVANLQAVMELSGYGGDLLIRGRALLALAEIAHAQGQAALADERIRSALAIFQTAGSGPWQAQALMALGHLKAAQGEHRGATEVWREALTLAGDVESELYSDLVRALSMVSVAE